MKFILSKIIKIYIFALIIYISTNTRINSRIRNKLLNLSKSSLSIRNPEKEEVEDKKEESEKTNKSEKTDNIEGWLTITSDMFSNLKKEIPEIKIKVDEFNTRINNEFEKAKKNGAKTNKDFYFHLKNGYIYYYADKDAEQLIEAIIIKDIKKDNNKNCFNIENFNQVNYKICATSEQEKYKWYCNIQKTLEKNNR